MATIYKIRRKSDGLFSTGGMSPMFKKGGKVWRQKNHLTSHLSLVSASWYCDCEIVTIEVIEQETSPPIDVSVYLAKRDAERQKQNDAHVQRIKEIEKQQRFAEYQKLKKEFE